jgi:hypothetical protein
VEAVSTAKLLQRPPAQKISPKQAALLQETEQQLSKLTSAAKKAAAACIDVRDHTSVHPGLTFMNSVLAARPVATLSQLLVWLQQAPTLLQLPELAAQRSSAAAGSAAATTEGSTNSSSSSNNNTASAADVSSGSSAEENYGRLWFTCTSGVLAHAPTATAAWQMC